jgi:4-hydroxy-tetrahydrodipicolinate reductase
MSKKQWHLKDARATHKFGVELAKHLSPGMLLSLRGDLGAGKTTLAKGVIATLTGLDPDDVTSPTFCLSLDYDEGPFAIRHLDAYRLDGSEALVDLGFLDWCEDGQTLILLEWPERVPDALPLNYLELHFELDGAGRKVTLQSIGSDAVGDSFAKSWAGPDLMMEANTDMKPLKIGIVGVPGRMAQRIATICHEQEDLQVSSAFARTESAAQGQHLTTLEGFPALAVKVSDSPRHGCAQVIIDFSTPAATCTLLERWAELGIPVVIGTTGLTDKEEKIIDEAAQSIAVLTASNTSLGVNLLEALVEQLAGSLGADYDIELVESHHKWKKDAPSGTALFLAKAAARGLGQELADCVQHGREGRDALRKRGEIGIHALRMGDVVGEHRVYFSAPGERIELGHVASSRDTFARGAIRAARFLSNQKPGRYAMKDVLWGS